MNNIDINTKMESIIFTENIIRLLKPRLPVGFDHIHNNFKEFIAESKSFSCNFILSVRKGNLYIKTSKDNKPYDVEIVYITIVKETIDSNIIKIYTMTNFVHNFIVKNCTYNNLLNNFGVVHNTFNDSLLLRYPFIAEVYRFDHSETPLKIDKPFTKNKNTLVDSILNSVTIEQAKISKPVVVEKITEIAKTKETEDLSLINILQKELDKLKQDLDNMHKTKKVKLTSESES